MNRLLFSALYVLAVLQVSGQSWIQDQATWHHRYADGSSGILGYVLTTLDGDTLLNDTLAYRLNGVLYGYSEQTQEYFIEEVPELLTTGTPDLALLWTGSAFDTLFHFAATPGQSWQPPGALPDGPELLTVMDTGHAVVDGEWLRYLVMDLGPLSSQPSPDTLFERLGSLNGYLDVWSSYLVDGGYGALRCYSDVDLSYAADDTPCDMILTVDGPLSSIENISLYPNPGSDRVWFDHLPQAGPLRTRVVDVRGSTVLEKTISDPRTGMDLSELAPGSYTILMNRNTGPSFSAKWVKQE